MAYQFPMFSALKPIEEGAPLVFPDIEWIQSPVVDWFADSALSESLDIG